MLTVRESIQKINQEKAQADSQLKVTEDRSKELSIILEFFADSFSELIRQIATGKYDVDVKNLPKTQKIEGKVAVEGLTGLQFAIDQLKALTKQNKLTLPDVQKVTGEVTVKNPTPETKIPDYPKQIKSDITSLPKYVQDLLTDLKKAIKGIEVKPEVKVETKASDVNIDLKSVVERLEGVEKAVKEIEIPEHSVDFSALEQSVKATTQAINDLKFPVPNFQSSYNHSLTMRAEDMDKEFAYTTDGATKVVESITVRDVDGAQYIKTYTYSGDGTGDPVTESKWERV